jgi:membrane protein YqaA with SNARE-associated domain
MCSRVYSPHGEKLLFTLVYLDAVCFLPADPMIIAYCLEKHKKSFRYATIATIASIIGGITEYALGIALWHIWGQSIIHSTLVGYLMKPETFFYLCGQYKTHTFLALVIASFAPIPFKATTLSAGFCALPLLPFVLGIALGRAGRFFLYALIIRIWGPAIKDSLDRYFNLIIITLSVIIGGTLFFAKH